MNPTLDWESPTTSTTTFLTFLQGSKKDFYSLTDLLPRSSPSLLKHNKTCCIFCLLLYRQHIVWYGGFVLWSPESLAKVWFEAEVSFRHISLECGFIDYTDGECESKQSYKSSRRSFWGAVLFFKCWIIGFCWNCLEFELTAAAVTPTFPSVQVWNIITNMINTFSCQREIWDSISILNEQDTSIAFQFTQHPRGSPRLSSNLHLDKYRHSCFVRLTEDSFTHTLAHLRRVIQLLWGDNKRTEKTAQERWTSGLKAQRGRTRNWGKRRKWWEK